MVTKWCKCPYEIIHSLLEINSKKGDKFGGKYSVRIDCWLIYWKTNRPYIALNAFCSAYSENAVIPTLYHIIDHDNMK